MPADERAILESVAKWEPERLRQLCSRELLESVQNILATALEQDRPKCRGPADLVSKSRQGFLKLQYHEMVIDLGPPPKPPSPPLSIEDRSVAILMNSVPTFQMFATNGIALLQRNICQPGLHTVVHDLQQYEGSDMAVYFRGPFALLELLNQYQKSAFNNVSDFAEIVPGINWQSLRHHITHARKVELFRRLGGVGITPLLAVNYHHWRHFSEGVVKHVVQFCQSNSGLSGLIDFFKNGDEMYRTTYRNSTQVQQLALAPPYATSVNTLPTGNATTGSPGYGNPATPNMLDLATRYDRQWEWDPGMVEGVGMLELSDSYDSMWRQMNPGLS